MDEDCENIRYEFEEQIEDREEKFSDELADGMLSNRTGRTTEGDVDFNPNEFDQTGTPEIRSLKPHEDLPEVDSIVGNTDSL